MINDYGKYLRVAQILNNTFGSDGDRGFQHINGMNVRLEPVDDGLVKARAIMTVTFRTDQMMREDMRRHRDQAVSLIQGAMTRAEEKYKEQFDDNIKLTMDEKTLDESVEFIHISQYTPVSRAFYRVITLIRVQ